ncbi:hypothetical protein [Poriferisphaera corsica]|nr:hypothetical protein [Poriferisphaera corsica]
MAESSCGEIVEVMVEECKMMGDCVDRTGMHEKTRCKNSGFVLVV